MTVPRHDTLPLAVGVTIVLCLLAPLAPAQDEHCVPPMPDVPPGATPGDGPSTGPAPGDGTALPLLPLLPELWVTGDTHAHVQLCGTPVPLATETLYANQKTAERQVTCAQLWGIYETIPGFMETWAPLVTGAEAPVSAADPDYVVQFGLEVSKFPAEQFGHVQAMGLSSVDLPLEAGYPAPILEAFRAQLGTLSGYAHVFWPTSYAPGPTAPYYGGIGYMAPVDAALGLVDFVEAVFQSEDLTQYDWRGMYYKLLHTGLRPSLAAGRDTTCALAPWDEIMAARVESEPPTFAGWLAAIRAGRTTVAEGPRFLDMLVDGAGIGSSVELGAPGPVTVTLHFVTAQAQTGVLRVVRDGVPSPNAVPYALPAGGSTTVQFSVPMPSSGWLAAEAKGDDSSDAHTGATWVIVRGQPVVRAADAQYCVDHVGALLDGLDAFAFASDAERDAARDHLEEGRAVLEALLAGALPLPAGVARYGLSAPACQGPVQIGVRDLPLVGSPGFAITNVHAPPGASGWLIVSTKEVLVPGDLGGAKIYVDLDASLAQFPVVANSGGFHEFPLPLPPELQGATLHRQYVWNQTVTCRLPDGGMAASDALSITVQ